MTITLTPTRPRIANPNNPYRLNPQGKANEPITVAAILDRAYKLVGDEATPDWSLEAIYDRLEDNAPRIAIIGGSPDHPAAHHGPGNTLPGGPAYLAAMAGCLLPSACRCSAMVRPRATWA